MDTEKTATITCKHTWTLTQHTLRKKCCCFYHLYWIARCSKSGYSSGQHSIFKWKYTTIYIFFSVKHQTNQKHCIWCGVVQWWQNGFWCNGWEKIEQHDTWNARNGHGFLESPLPPHTAKQHNKSLNLKQKISLLRMLFVCVCAVFCVLFSLLIFVVLSRFILRLILNIRSFSARALLSLRYSSVLKI